MSLEGRVVVVTGAAGGIGRALAVLLAKQGARLVLADIRPGGLEELRALLSSGPGRALCLEHDVTQSGSWQALLARSLETFGGIDVLINNAGVVQPAMAWAADPAEISRQISVNLLGTILGCRAVLPLMKERNSGRIVNIASLGGIVPMPGEAVYCASKFGIRGYSLSLAAELHGTGVKVALVCPDSVDTPQLAHELRHDEAVMSFLGKPLAPERVAGRILRAASKKKVEVLVPAGRGVMCRMAMAVPGIYLGLWPALRKAGLRAMAARRRSGDPADVLTGADRR